MRTTALILIISALMGLAAGCSSSECYDNHSALPLAYFYSSSTQRQVTLQNVEIYGVDAPNDSILYKPGNLSEAYLPFRLWQDTTQYVLLYRGMVSDSIASLYPNRIPRDTLTFIYEPKEWFVSPACGAMYFYDMEKTLHTTMLIDSVYTNEVITNENAANIRIFFRQDIAQ